MKARIAGLTLALLLAAPPCSLAAGTAEASETVLVPAGTRSGREIYERFREGLADPTCKADASTRWQAHFAHAPGQLAARNGEVLPLFGYVVDAVRAAHLPTEYALIPFVESGYKPGARSPQGPAGLWQMIAVTARNHQVPIRAGYDGRLSPVDSTTAAVRYLKTLHGMFAGDWRLAVMAYNAGEYRVLGALKRAGQTARDARPEALPGMSQITHAYVRKLHALSCLLDQARDRDEWLRALDHPVPVLEAVEVASGVTDLAAWARRNGQDVGQLQRLNPALAGGRLPHAKGQPLRLLAVARDGRATEAADPVTTAAEGAGAVAESAPAVKLEAAGAADLAAVSSIVQAGPVPGENEKATLQAIRRHTVARGDSAWKIAARYGIHVADLLARNGLSAASVLRPGRVLLIDAEPGTSPAR